MIFPLVGLSKAFPLGVHLIHIYFIRVLLCPRRFLFYSVGCGWRILFFFKKNGAARLQPWEIFVLLALKIPFHFISLRKLKIPFNFIWQLPLNWIGPKKKVHHILEIAFGLKKEIPLNFFYLLWGILPLG